MQPFEHITQAAAGVYCIRHTWSGKVYVGSAMGLVRRYKDHFRKLRGGYHHNRHLQAVWNLYGESAFEFIVLERHADPKALTAAEQAYIDAMNAVDRRFGYNARPTAESNLGMRWNQETREKIRQANLGKRYSAETNAKKGWTRGIKLPPEHGQRISAAKRCKPRPAGMVKGLSEKFRKFTVEQAEEIRRKSEEGMKGYQLAALYGCSQATISYVLNRKDMCYGSGD